MTYHDPKGSTGRGSPNTASGRGATQQKSRAVPIDPLAVDVVASGSRWVPLTRRERRAVIVQLTGKVTDGVIAQRLRSTCGAVSKVRSRMRADGTWEAAS